MTLLIPLGLLGLLSIIALIVIYIIKPNYQHKEVTSTYVWKLSLKYRKKRLPSSKLRNILLIVCQVLALVAGALIMSQPIIRDDKGVFDTEVIAVIDASASMRAEENGTTRFERAVNEVIDLSNDTIDGGGYVSVILSDGNERFLMQKAGLAAKSGLIEMLEGLIDKEDDLACGYGSSNIDNAIGLCESVVNRNPSAAVYLYTDKTYAYVPDGINLVNVANDGEWNVGILNAYTEFEEGYYTFFVELGCYGGVARTVNLNVSINGANDDRSYVAYSSSVTLRDNSTTTVVFRNSDITISDYEQESENIVIVPVGAGVTGQYNKTLVYGYNDAHISIDESDSLETDNNYSLYGGRKNQLKILYVTSNRRTLMTAMLATLRQNYSDRWEIEIDDVDPNNLVPGEQVPVKGYDLYIFHEYYPTQIPQDGVVYFANPPSLPAGLTRRDVHTYSREMYLAKEGDHPILADIDEAKIFARRITRLAQYDEVIYKPLWSVDDNPVLLINDGEDEKIIVSLFSFEWSNFELTTGWPYFITNIFDYFLPATVVGNTFEVGQEITVNARSTRLSITRNSGSDERIVTAFPSRITLDKPDTYRFSQIGYFGDALPDNYIFVKIPSAESNIAATGVAIRALYREDVGEDKYQDLMVYLAAAMLALLFTEWFLQTQESL